jgi:hypothetical protein
LWNFFFWVQNVKNKKICKKWKDNKKTSQGLKNNEEDEEETERRNRSQGTERRIFPPHPPPPGKVLCVPCPFGDARKEHIQML